MRGVLRPGASERVFRSERIESGQKKALAFILGAYGGKSGARCPRQRAGPCACGAGRPPLRLRLKAGDGAAPFG